MKSITIKSGVWVEAKDSSKEAYEFAKPLTLEKLVSVLEFQMEDENFFKNPTSDSVDMGEPGFFIDTIEAYGSTLVAVRIVELFSNLVKACDGNVKKAVATIKKTAPFMGIPIA